MSVRMHVTKTKTPIIYENKCFGLPKKFLLKDIFTKYPEIANEIKANAHMRYQKYLKKPIKEKFKSDIKMKNKKSSYNMVKYEEKGNVPE